MIQRKQTLFLFQLVFFGIALLFISNHTVTDAQGSTEVYLVPFHNSHLSSTAGHSAAIAINFLGLCLATVVIFLYKRRELQLKLSYGLALLWMVLSLMLAFCPFVGGDESSFTVSLHIFPCIIGVVGIAASLLAARFIKKDIELLKSADRIR